MIYLFYGNDDFKIKKTADEIIARAKEAELSIFEEINLSDAILALKTNSFFTTNRVFLIKNCLDKLIDKNEADLAEALKTLENTHIIFIEPKLPKSKITDQIKKVGKVQGFEKPKKINLVAYIKEKVEEQGGDIAPLAAERLSTFVGNDMWKLEEEIKKLVLYKTGLDEPIETADVDLLVKANFEANIFNLMDAVAAKNTRRSIELVNSFLESGENAIYIFTMIWRQFRIIAMAKFEPNMSEGTLVKKAKLHPFVAGKALRAAKGYTSREIMDIYGRLTRADLALKSGAEPESTLLRILI